MPRAATTTRKEEAEARIAPEPREPSPRPLGRVLSPRQFWDIMERWRVPDAIALELIEFPGKLGKEGKRPRFRFTTRQQRIASYLPEIDAVLAATGNDQTWLHRKIQGAPFSRRTPIEYMMARGMEGMADSASPQPRCDAIGSGQTGPPTRMTWEQRFGALIELDGDEWDLGAVTSERRYAENRSSAWQ